MTVALGVFGRAPVPGRTKTRLIPALGAQGAASLYAAMLRDVLDHARSADGFSVTFWSADATESPELEALLAGVPRRVQCEGTLGARMAHALEAGCRTHGRALLVGSDAPTLSVALLREASAALGHTDAVLSPAEDGGYSLIGTRRLAAGAFDGVRFSSPHTLEDTERGLRAAGLTVERVSACTDVDDGDDLERLRVRLVAQPDLAPHTARWLGVQRS